MNPLKLATACAIALASTAWAGISDSIPAPAPAPAAGILMLGLLGVRRRRAYPGSGSIFVTRAPSVARQTVPV